ncbi:unnamed protein product [Closterium sp. NIES-64]|nr:unnamed protein product [Closterium sp. NIES-64]
MMERGLWGLFDGTEKKPVNEDEIAAWKKKDQKAFATLIPRISINLVSSVRTCIKLEASVREAWKRLETMHKTLHGKILARNAFYTVKMRAGESMHEYATRVEELGETFIDLGGTITEEDWILTLLCGLPEEWSTVITTLDSVQSTWTKKMVVGRLLHEESRRRQFVNESEGTAMFSGGSSGKKSKWSKGEAKKSSGGNEHGKGNASNGSSKCHYCRKAGHFWRECRKRPSDWTPSKARNQEGNAHTASGEADDSTESLVLLAGDGINTSNDAWFLDPGATQHMTHSASLLNNIGAPGDVKRVVFGNDKSLPVVGAGSTRLIVDSGPVDITNVLHVPGLKVNLLSVTQLVKKDVKITIDGAKMNLFWKGKQFAQGVLNEQLYQLKTHPNTTSSNVAQGSKATLKMWHNRLAHANYDSVKELANKGLAKGFDVIAGDDEKGLQPKARAAIHMGIVANERAWRVWDLDEKRVVTSRDAIFDEAKFPTAEKQAPQLTDVLPAREEDEAVEVPPHVHKGAESGGGENEECDDDVEEVPPTEEATSSATSSLPLALTRGRRTPRPNTSDHRRR